MDEDEEDLYGASPRRNSDFGGLLQDGTQIHPSAEAIPNLADNGSTQRPPQPVVTDRQINGDSTAASRHANDAITTTETQPPKEEVPKGTGPSAHAPTKVEGGDKNRKSEDDKEPPKPQNGKKEVYTYGGKTYPGYVHGITPAPKYDVGKVHSDLGPRRGASHGVEDAAKGQANPRHTSTPATTRSPTGRGQQPARRETAPPSRSQGRKASGSSTRGSRRPTFPSLTDTGRGDGTDASQDQGGPGVVGGLKPNPKKRSEPIFDDDEEDPDAASKKKKRKRAGNSDYHNPTDLKKPRDEDGPDEDGGLGGLGGGGKTRSQPGRARGFNSVNGKSSSQTRRQQGALAPIAERDAAVNDTATMNGEDSVGLDGNAKNERRTVISSFDTLEGSRPKASYFDLALQPTSAPHKKRGASVMASGDGTAEESASKKMKPSTTSGELPDHRLALSPSESDSDGPLPRSQQRRYLQRRSTNGVPTCAERQPAAKSRPTVISGTLDWSVADAATIRHTYDFAIQVCFYGLNIDPSTMSFDGSLRLCGFTNLIALQSGIAFAASTCLRNSIVI